MQTSQSTRPEAISLADEERVNDVVLGAVLGLWDVVNNLVDGKPCHDGVAAFLAARSSELPAGTPEDGPGLQTVHALGTLKDQYFMEHLRRHGVDRHEDAIVLVQALRAQDVRAAVVSSSNNCAAVLEAAGITPLFGVTR